MAGAERVAIVTGSSRGIGAAIAKRLARDGLGVVVNYSGREQDAVQIVQEIEAARGKAIPVRADVSDPAAVARMFQEAEQGLGPIDVLVNNAGIMPLAPVIEMDDRSFDRLVAINLKGTFNGMREAGKRLRAGGRVVNFSSSVVGLKPETYGAYAATKAAVETLSAIFAKELRGRSITVNVVAPGPTGTELFLQGKSQDHVDRLAQANPFGRLGTPEDIARVVSFLVGPDGGWVNGQTIRVNGGMV